MFSKLYYFFFLLFICHNYEIEVKNVVSITKNMCAFNP